MALNNEAIQKAYRRLSKFYDFYFGAVFHPGRRTVVELLPKKPGLKVLEVGVGTGLSLSLYSKSAEVTGIDLSAEMLKQAQWRVREYKLDHVKSLQIMNAEQMSFESNTFDVVVAMYVASVVEHPKLLISEIQRVCKPAGQIIIVNHFQKKGVDGAVVGWLSPVFHYLGFRSNLTIPMLLEGSTLKIINQITVNLLDYWTIVNCKNEKS